MKMLSKLLLLIGLFLSSLVYGQSVYYVATDGSDANPGTLAQPFATVQAAINATTTPGDTVYFRNGTYYSLTPSGINPTTGNGVSGVWGNPVVYSSYPGEWAIFDCSAHCGNGATYNGFVSFSYAEHIHFKNMEITKVFQCSGINNGVFNATYSRNLEFHNVIIHDLSVPRGFWIAGGAWATHAEDPNFDVAPSYWGSVAEGGSIDTTRFINVDVYNTCDTLGGGNAGDGWKIVTYGNNHFEWIGCRAWNYSDDGIDPNNIDGATHIVEDSWFMSTDKYERFDLEGNGAKFSAMVRNNSNNPDEGHFLTFRNVINVDGIGGGFVDNLNSPPRPQLNTLFENNIVYKRLFGYNPKTETVFKNNISFENDRNTWEEYSFPQAKGSNNSFSIVATTGYADSITITPWNFLSIDLGEITRPRNPDGSLPYIDLFRPREGSPLIDAGTADLSQPRDSAGVTAITPDIGRWEYIPRTGPTDKHILSFTFDNQSGYSVYDTVNHTVHATIYYANRGEIPTLQPIVLPSDGDTISPGFQTVVDFSVQPVIYDVYPIGSPLDIQQWSVYVDTVSIEDASPYANVRGFSHANVVRNIDTVNNYVGVFYASGTDITSMSPTITIDRGATTNYHSLIPHNFNTNLNFTVTAEDGTVKNWTIQMDEMVHTDDGEKLGYNLVFPTEYDLTRIQYTPIDVTQSGDIEGISIYHEGGTGNILVGLYASDGDGYAYSRLGVSNALPISGSEGWQEFQFTTPVAVTTGTRYWMAFAFENAVSYRRLGEQYGNSLQSRRDTWGYAYSYGLRDPAPNGGGALGNLLSVYANYVVGGTPVPPQSAIYRHLGSGGKVYYFNGKYLK